VISRKGLGDERWQEDRPKVTMQACLKLTGTVVESPKSPTDGEEMQVESIVLLGVGDGDFRSEVNAESDTHVHFTKDICFTGHHIFQLQRQSKNV